MPTYDYVCNNCHKESQHIQSMKDEWLTHCDSCGTSSLERVILQSHTFFDTNWPRANESVKGRWKNGKFYPRVFDDRGQMREYYKKHGLVLK